MIKFSFHRECCKQTRKPFDPVIQFVMTESTSDGTNKPISRNETSKRRSIRIGRPKTPGTENFTTAGREEAGTLQEARGKGERREKSCKRNSVRGN
jgi:hypothetical protein